MMQRLEQQRAGKKHDMRKKMRMLRWMRNDSIRNEHISDEDDRGAHSEKNARCGHTREKKNKEAKSKMKRCVYEIYDIGGVQR